MKSLAEILTSLASQVKQVEVAMVDVQLAKDLNQLKAEHKVKHAEIKRKIAAFAEELKSEHAPECEEYHENVEKAWAKIYEAAGIPQEEGEAGNFSIDSRTGVVTQTIMCEGENADA